MVLLFRAAVAAIIAGMPMPSSAMNLHSIIPETIPLRVQAADGDGAARINLSGKLRMLSQRIAASACNAAAGIAVDESAPMLQSASAEFSAIVGALRFGNPEMGIADVEEDRQIQAKIADLRAVWDPMQEQIAKVANSPVDTDLARDLAIRSAPLLEEAKLLVSLESAAYSDPTALIQADAMLIDISGRQRMLAQRVSKNVCLAQNGDAAAIEELKVTMDTYSASLTALRNGMSEVGVRPPPTEEIEKGLDRVAADWAAMQPVLTRVLAGEKISQEDRAEIYLGANGLTGKMNVLVGQYEAASTRGT